MVGYLNQSPFLLRQGVVKVSRSALPFEVLQRIGQLENALSQRLHHIEERLTVSAEVFLLFSDGLKAHRDRYLKEAQLSRSEPQQWLGKVQADKELRFPHRKILEFLLSQYDYERRQFREAHFSKLVGEARVGKNMAQTYLALLIQKGYVEERSDGYRKFYRMRGYDRSAFAGTYGKA